MKKRVISILLALLIMIPMVLVPANAFSTISFSKTTKLNTPVTFAATDFTNRVEYGAGETAITHVNILTLPDKGTLKLGGVAVAVPKEISVDLLDTLTFEPQNNFFGDTTFDFTAKNKDGTATNPKSIVTISVSDIVPEAKDLSFSTPRNTSLTENLVGTDEKGRYLSFAIKAQPTTGGTVKKSNGTDEFSLSSGTYQDSPTFVFVPTEDFSGVVTFEYIVKSDDNKYSKPGKVTIYVGGVPTALDQTVNVVRNTPKTITLKSTDPENRTRAYSIITNPKNGTLTPTTTAGQYTYRPNKDYLGSDTFTFRATVTGGTVVSNTATVTINVQKYDIPSFSYADMNNHWAATSANGLAGLGFVVGEKFMYSTGSTVSEKYYFHPEAPITRGEFLLFLTAALKIEPDTSSVSLFNDDVPDWLIGPSNALNKKNIVLGTLVGTKRNLKQGEVLNRLEAMTLIDRSLVAVSKSSTVPTYSDMASVPSWGVQAVKNLTDYGIVQGDTSNNVMPFSPMTRAAAAEMLFKSYKQLVLEAG